MAPRILLLSLLFLTVSPPAMPAQVTIIDGDQPWIRCDTCWRGYDSVLPHFTIGAIDFKYPDSAAAWGLDFTTLYGMPDLPRLARTIDTPGVDHLCEHPFIRHLDTLTSRLWRRADSAGFGIIAPLGPLTRIQSSTRREEWHAGGTGRIQLLTATRGYWSDSAWGSHGSVWELPADQRETARYGQIAAPKMPRATEPTLTRVLEGNPYSGGEVFFPGDPAWYDSLGGENRSLIFRATVSFVVKPKDSVEQAAFEDLHDTTELARIVLYRRWRGGQEDCHCRIVEPFAERSITKADYVTPETFDPPAWTMDDDGYRRFDLTFDMGRSNSQQIRARDTVILHRYYEVCTGDTVTAVDEDYAAAHPFVNRRPEVDSVPWIRTGVRYDTLSWVDSAGSYYNRYYTAVRVDTMVDLHVGLTIPGPLAFAFGFTPALFSSGDTCSFVECEALLDSAKRAAGFVHLDSIWAGNVRRSWLGEQSDFHMRVYSTRAASLVFYSYGVHQDLYDSLRQGRLDPIMRRQVDLLDSVNPLIRRGLTRLRAIDEPTFARLRSEGYVSRLMTTRLNDNGHDDIGTFQNPPGNFDGHRIFTEDMDHIGWKTEQLISRQDYSTNGGTGSLVPAYYADPDQMEPLALEYWWKPRDTTRISAEACGIAGLDTMVRLTKRMIAYPMLSDHDRYTMQRQCALGTFRLADDPLAHKTGPFVRQTARAVDVARFRYLRYGPPAPVVVQLEGRGWLNMVASQSAIRDEQGGAWVINWLHRPATPLESTVQAWLAINCHASGIVWTDGGWDGTQVGFFNVYHIGTPLGDITRLADPNLARRGSDTLRFVLPTMWHGIDSRGAAIRLVNHTIKQLDSIVGLTRLEFRREQISLHDTLDDLDRIPMLATVRARKAMLYDTTAQSQFVDSVIISGSDTDYVYDPPRQAYLEVTHWLAGDNLPDEQARDVRYVLFTNRRTYPIDRRDYGDSAAGHAAYIRMVDSATGLYDPSESGFHVHGLGAIDVRRPVVVLKNSTNVLADSAHITKVLDTTWSVTASFGDTVELDWLAPGWGEMYRLTPIPRGVSSLGVAFNNAARAQNPSTDTLSRSIITVYERDSIVYMRLNHPDGSWSDELMVSDPNDTLSTSRAWNVSPAVAIPAVDTASSALIVWERRVPVPGQNPLSSILAKHYPTRPDTGSLPTATIMELDSAVQVSHAVLRTPAVVGTDSGYAVAWGSPLNGIEMVAIRDTVLPTNGWSNYVSTVSTTVAPNVPVRMPPNQAYTLDSLSLFPSMAYVRQERTANTRVTVVR